ncbi:MAG TPA: cyclopropane-fatty-acyl-phospholipid synthase family protein [Jiangellaceae bacterium]
MTLLPAQRHTTTSWPELAVPPRSPLRAWLAERLFRRAVRQLDLTVEFPDGERLGGSAGAPVLRLERPDAFFNRLGVNGNIGFAEAYLARDWTADTDLADVLTPFAESVATLVSRPLQALRRWVDAVRPESDDNTTVNAKSNISRHYDLSNDLFAAFLDETMTYSAAWFGPDDDLAAAQRRKIDSILDLAAVGAGSRVLEVGTGWGALAIRAAERGAVVTSLTLSKEQQALAERRINDAGVGDRVTVLLQDYREAGGQFDAVVAVEMIEAVGARYWPLFFATLDQRLVPGGRIALQAITMPHDRLQATHRSYTWVHKYIFPGGQLLSTEAIRDQVRRHTGLQMTARRALGPHYARTLALWRARFTRAAAHISALGFDDTFRRMWEFYLAYSEAGFRSGYLDVWQIQLSKPLARGVPEKVPDLGELLEAG